jgi:MFS family permease
LLSASTIEIVMFGDFFDNIGRYPSYFVTIILGIFFSAFGWLAPLWKRPITAVALVGFLVGTVMVVVLTLRAMLGITPVT